MSDQVTPAAEPTAAPAATPPAAPGATASAPAPVLSTATTPANPGGKTFTESELEAILKDRLDREKAKREKAAQDAAEKAAQEAAAKNGEWEKLAKQNEQKLAELQAQLKARELADLKRTIAERTGLPLALAARLIGETEKDLEADAKALLETLPKPPAPAPAAPRQPGILPANPGANGSTALTIEQQRARIYGAPDNPWDVALNRQQGGGVVFTEKEGRQ